MCGDIRGGNERERMGDEEVVEVKVFGVDVGKGLGVPEDVVGVGV